jgi:hypothetical protein
MHMNLSKQLEEGELTWYMELWGNGKRVTTWMPVGGGGAWEGEDNWSKQATHELMSHSNIEHGLVF